VRAARSGPARVALGALVLSALAGCGGRGDIVLLESGVQPGVVETVFVVSARRSENEPVYFASDRSEHPEYAVFDVSIPPRRKPGTVTYPRGSRPDPATDFLVTDTTRFAGAAAFVEAIDAEVATVPRHNGRATLFVHGYNTNFAEGLYRQAQIQHDTDRHGVSVHFTWPSAATTLGYEYDRESALYSRDALAEAIEVLEASKVTGYNLAAHSMGAFLLMDALRTIALAEGRAALSKVNEVVLISPDIEIDVFRKQAPPVLALGIPIFVIVSSDDRALRIAAELRGEHDRLGSIVSVDEIAGLDVTVIDVSDVPRPDRLGHFKVGTSPQLIDFLKHLNDQGLDIFDEDKRTGFVEGGIRLIQTGTDILVEPVSAH
jgi:esterase/lipase superfamily enzyme